MSAITPLCMDPPCVARETVRLEYGLAPMYQASFGARAPGHHGNPRASDLISDHASKAISGASSRMRLEDQFSISSLSLADLGRQNDRGVYIVVLLVVSSTLTMAVTVAASRDLGYGPGRSDLEVAIAMENAPGDAGDFVGERNRQLEPIEPPGCSFNPGFETMLFPALRV